MKRIHHQVEPACFGQPFPNAHTGCASGNPLQILPVFSAIKPFQFIDAQRTTSSCVTSGFGTERICLRTCRNTRRSPGRRAPAPTRASSWKSFRKYSIYSRQNHGLHPYFPAYPAFAAIPSWPSSRVSRHLVHLQPFHLCPAILQISPISFPLQNDCILLLSGLQRPAGHNYTVSVGSGITAIMPSAKPVFGTIFTAADCIPITDL
jgi:hypothetical protein